MNRISPTWQHEQQLAAHAPIIFGFDEVGRGALAGPVMVGCTAIYSSRLIPTPPQLPSHLADSKMLTALERERLFDPLTTFVDAWAVGAASNNEIDEAGITHALGLAALRALDECEKKLRAHDPHVELSGSAGILDGPNDYITKAASAMDAPHVAVLPTITTVVKGDAQCAIVAAASDLAKVTRDRLMVQLGKQAEYAPYDWPSNKGYGTRAHRQAIAEHGPSDLHRVTWHLV